MKRKIVGVLGAVLLAGVGTFALVAYVQSARDEAAAGERMVKVWVVQDAIAEDTPVSDIEESLEQKSVPGKLLAEGAVTDLDDLEGMVAGTDLVPGEQLVAGRFVTPSVSRQGDVPAGLLQVTVELDPARAIGGQVREGDTVGVVLSFEGEAPDTDRTHLQLHKVLVTSVSVASDTSGTTVNVADGDEGEEGDVKTTPSGSILVTLALDAPSVERVVFTAEFGTIYLTREPEDAPEKGTRIVTPDDAFDEGPAQ